MDPTSNPAAELGDLVAGLLGSVVSAQATLDTDAQARTDAWLNDHDDGDLTPPPLWFTVGSTALEVQLAARVTRLATGRPQQADRVSRRILAIVQEFRWAIERVRYAADQQCKHEDRKCSQSRSVL